jgi:carboxyl-terminal processing protease
VEVNGESTRDWDTEMAVSQLRGPRGSKVRIMIARPGVDQPMPIEITREEIHIQAVPSAYVMEGGVGYVELVSFAETSTDELRQAIQRLRTEGARGVILDLRRNPGGLLEQGATVADLFLNRGQVIVETKGRAANQNHRMVARTADQFPGLPVVVLVEPQSASASEIVAGALQDHDRALVLGRTTYGKGSVQTVFPLTGQHWLKITTARWYTPVGRSIQKPYGIDAHPVELDDGALTQQDTAARPEYRTDSGRTVYGGGGIHPDLIVGPDTLSLAERPYRQAVIRKVAEWRAAQTAMAVEIIRANPQLRPDFQVTPAMRDLYFRHLRQREVIADRELLDAAQRIVDQEIVREVMYSKWGEQATSQRLNAEDAQVRAAADLLRRATTPQSLFTLASTSDAARAAVVR